MGVSVQLPSGKMVMIEAKKLKVDKPGEKKPKKDKADKADKPKKEKKAKKEKK